MKIGLFGGTFDPPHLGHIKLATDFYKISGVDLLIIMPSFIPPHKNKTANSAFHRYEMAKLAFLFLGEKGINYSVSDYELKKGDVSYTIDTVNYLLDKYNEETLHLCVGSDMFLSFESWKHSDILMKKCILYTKQRHDGELDTLLEHKEHLKNAYNANIKIIDETAFTLSSTYLRSNMSNLKEYENLVPESVSEYIKNNGLYL